MKRFYLVLSIISVALLVSCQSKDEKQAKNNEGKVIDCLKASLQCPSTLKVVSISQKIRNTDIHRDTLCHLISRPKRKDVVEPLLPILLAGVKTVTVDSLQEVVRTYPAHTRYTIVYDAQNTFGAMVRDEDEVALLEDGTALMSDEYFSKYYECPQVKKWAIAPVKYTNISDEKAMFLIEGEWSPKSRLLPEE